MTANAFVIIAESVVKFQDMIILEEADYIKNKLQISYFKPYVNLH